jgi:hypothetical protein
MIRGSFCGETWHLFNLEFTEWSLKIWMILNSNEDSLNHDNPISKESLEQLPNQIHELMVNVCTEEKRICFRLQTLFFK